MRDILYPRDVHFSFYKDSMLFVGFMAIVGIGGFCATLPLLLANGLETEDIIDKSLDLLTVTVPPALPATMSVGVAFAIGRLKKSKIFCISPPRVNVSGMIQMMVFDKTGTLTEDGLQIQGFRAMVDSVASTPKFTKFYDSIQNLLEVNKNEHKVDFMNLACACCHAVTYVFGNLVGDPLEIKMFEMTNWILNEDPEGNNSLIGQDDIALATIYPKDKSHNLAIIKRFDFESKLQRMSTIVKYKAAKTDSNRSEYISFVKGSPEMIKTLSRPETIPDDFDKVLNEYTVQGLRMIAFGYRKLENVNYLKVMKV